MNQNVGASFGLSVLTVVFFAVILYQPDPKAAVPPLAGSSAVPIETVEALPPPAPAGVAPVGVVDLAPDHVRHTPLAAAPKVIAPVTAEKTPTTPRSDTATRAAAVARPVSRRTPHAATGAETRGAFTRVRPGETLPDVARRVYGTAHKARALWLANRDVVDRDDAPLAAGSLLRTP